jgi:hypothetical protein
MWLRVNRLSSVGPEAPSGQNGRMFCQQTVYARFGGPVLGWPSWRRFETSFAQLTSDPARQRSPMVSNK